MSIKTNYCLKLTFYSYSFKGFFQTDSRQTIHFKIRLTGYLFYVIVKPYGLTDDKALDSLRDCSSIPHVVTYDLADKFTKQSTFTVFVLILYFTK